MLIFHSLKVVSKILVKRKSFLPKLDVFLCYLRLVIGSYRQRYFPKDGILEENILSFTVSFFNYIELIFLFEEIFVNEVYLLRQKPNRIIDCGANIGLSIIFFKLQSPECSITAFEPDKENYSLLQRNLSRNRITNVTMYMQALGSQDNVSMLYSPKNSNTRSLNASLIKPSSAFESTRVYVKNLSTYISEQVDLLKIDVEGAETEIVKDLVNSRKINAISNIVVEFHPELTKIPLAEFLSFFSNNPEHRLNCTVRGPAGRGTEALVYASLNAQEA